MAKMTKAEREECEKNLEVCRSAVAAFEKLLAADDAAEKTAQASSDRETVAAIAKRDGMTAGVYAARELGRRGGPQS